MGLTLIGLLNGIIGEAALAVDRNKLILLRQPLFDDSNKRSLSGNSTEQTSAIPRNFMIEIRDKP